MRRGIVIPSPVEIISSRPDYFFMKGKDGDDYPKMLRQVATYWDQAECPYIGLTTNEKISSDIDFLVSSNMLTMTQLEVDGALMGYEGAHALRRGLVQTFYDNATNGIVSGEKWAMGDYGRNIILPGDFTNSYSVGVQLDILNYIPTPSADTPIEQILEFRSKHQDSLEAFQTALNPFYETLIGDIGGKISSKPYTLSVLEDKIKDVNNAMKMSGIKRYLSSLSVQLDATSIKESAIVSPVQTIAGVVATTMFADIPLDSLPASALAGVVGGGLVGPLVRAAVRVGQSPHYLPDHLKDFRYIMDVDSKFG